MRGEAWADLRLLSTRSRLARINSETTHRRLPCSALQCPFSSACTTMTQFSLCFACNFAALPRPGVSRWRADASPVGTNSPPRRRRGGITPDAVRQRRHAREHEGNERDTLVASWAGVVLARSSKCEVRTDAFAVMPVVVLCAGLL
jgi:hypothetical protein